MVIAAERSHPAFAQTSTASIWLGAQQQAGLTHLCSDAPVRVLIGPESCGKTTLLRHFRHHLDELIALDLGGPLADGVDVLTRLLHAVALDVGGLAAGEQRNLLGVFFRERRCLGTRIILCIDDIAGIEPPAWDEIMALSALESSGRPLVELAVVGSLAEAERPPLRDLVLDGRTSAVEAVRYLGAPDADDIRRYIRWQLERIGGTESFSAAALSHICSLSRGRFDEINRLCAAVLASRRFGRRAKAIEAKDIDVAAAGRQPLRPSERPAASSERPVPAGEAAAPATGTEASSDRLVIEREGEIERIVPLAGRLVIGRNDDSDLRLDGPGISRNHAMIIPAGEGRLALVDLNSVHGIYVNGRRVQRKILKTGDVIGLDRYRLKLISSQRRSEGMPYPGAAASSRSRLSLT